MKRTGFPRQDELILFRKRKEPSLGIFTGTAGEKITLFSEEGREISIDTEKLAFPSGITIEGELTQSEKKLRLREIRRSLEGKKDGVDLVTVWECFEGTEGEVPFAEISDLYFGGKEASNEDTLLLFWAVDKNDVYFRRGEVGYEPRAREETEEILRKKEAEERRKEERENAVYWAKGVISGHAPKEERGFDPSGYIELIRGYVIHLDKFGRAGEAKSFLSQVGVSDPEGAIEFLIKAGGWSEDEDPMMKRFSIREDFPEDVESQARSMIEAELPEEGFEDLTDLAVFSIDDENTEDIDDALSVSVTPEGTLIGVHIANVAALVPKWSPADDEASRRGETIYLPEKCIHMFPADLVKEKLSLVENTERAALSLLVLYDDDMIIKSLRFVNSKIRIARNMTYSEGSEYFLNDPGGIRMREIALRLRQKRLEAGALIVQLPQLKIRIGEKGGITLEKNLMNSPAHVVVAEMMILMNRMAGKYLKDGKIPGIFRSQPEPVSEETRSLDETDPLYPVRVVRFLRAPRVGLAPEPHKPLGLDVYTQVTSPIRRFTDLITQRQIVSDLLWGEEAYSEEELENLYPMIETAVRDKRALERQREKYWLYKYLKTLEGREIEGIVSSSADNRVNVYLPEFLFEASVNAGSIAEPEEGKRVRLLVQKADPLRKTLRLVPLPGQ